MNIVRKIAVLTVVLSTVTGCATSQGLYDPQTGQYTRSVDVDIATPTAVGINTASGAILGGVLGGLAGVAVGDPASGVALGAAVGGLMGASSTQKQTIIKPQAERQYAPSREQKYAQKENRATSPVNSDSQCTDEYRLAEQEIIAIVAKKQQEAANYQTETNDRTGATEIVQETDTWLANSDEAIRMKYKNCISQITSGVHSARERYAEPQVIYVEPQQPAVVISEPAISFPQVPYYGSYYPSYGYHPYYGGYNNARAHWELEQRRLYAHWELEQRRMEAHRNLWH